MKFDHPKFIDSYKTQHGVLNDSQASGMDRLLGFLEQDKDVGDVRWAAYMLATVKEECAGTWQPIEEIGKGQGYPYGNPVPVTGSDGKTYVNAYYGRGYPQLTGADLYRKMSQDLNLGDQLLIHPERALDPTISYNALSFGMRKGAFTGVGLGDFINGSRCDYVNARRIVNGLDAAQTIADYAVALERLLRESSTGAETGPQQYHIVNAPDGVNARQGPGSNFPVVHGVPNDSQIDIVCQVHGEVVNGSDIWNKLADGTYVSDFYCDTPNFNAFSPPIPVCQDAVQLAPVPPQPLAVPPGPRTYQHHIVNAPDGLNARKGPGTNFPVVHNLANNSPIDISCQVHGEVVNGSNIWNRLADGTYITDFYCDTANFNAFSPPIPVCKDAPQPPAQPGIKGDDYPYKDSQPDAPGGDRWAFYARECTSFVAWRMNQLGVNFSNHMTGPNGTAGTFGNGDTWAANARAIGFRVDNTPSAGAIAHFDDNHSGSGPSGHVAYVAQVNGDGTIVIEEYNWAPFPYGYHNPPRVIRASDVSNFIHIVS
jgi:surface antigen